MAGVAADWGDHGTFDEDVCYDMAVRGTTHGQFQEAIVDVAPQVLEQTLRVALRQRGG